MRNQAKRYKVFSGAQADFIMGVQIYSLEVFIVLTIAVILALVFPTWIGTVLADKKAGNLYYAKKRPLILPIGVLLYFIAGIIYFNQLGEGYMDLDILYVDTEFLYPFLGASSLSFLIGVLFPLIAKKGKYELIETIKLVYPSLITLGILILSLILMAWNFSDSLITP